jgi:hypothetical protein
MKTNNGYPSAWIVNPNDRGRKKIYLNNKVYLENGSEFIIELFNPLQDSVLAELKINGKLASNSGLILRPGERFYLDCNIDDRKKFVFNTYEVDANDQEAQKAIEKNGYVEINFYREKAKPKPMPKYKYTTRSFSSGGNFNNPGIYSNDVYYSNTNTSSMLSMDFLGNTPIVTAGAGETLGLYQTQLKEVTGRIEKGDTSSQQFVTLDMDFEQYSVNCVAYQLLPESKKPIETAELKRNFCSDCGNKLKGTEKFCSNCGVRV